jgi:tRNA(Met) cytidine acetyltransferase
VYSDFSEFCRQLQTQAKQTAQRRVLLLCGARDWASARAGEALHSLGVDQVLWVGDRSPHGWPCLAPAQAHKLLGAEIEGLVIDSYAGFDPEAFGATLGALRSGGLLLLITPPLDQWEGFIDPQNARIAVAPTPAEQVTGRFLRRLAAIFRTSDLLYRVVQDRPLPNLKATLAQPLQSPLPTGSVCRTADQQLAVQALMQVAKGHRRRPLVLISDRGRGKSSSLGIAAARLLQEGMQRIIITGPRLDAVTPALEQAKRLLPDYASGRGHLRGVNAAFCFMPPDALSQQPEQAGLLLVDEAAALPTALLERLLRRYSRIAFATTLHGYEGSGRGFSVRFRKILDQQTPQWRQIELRQPIRWAADDPLERLSFQALLLDAAPASDAEVAGCCVDDSQLERLERDRLASDEALLRQLFGLLVLAHYRTSPLDLRHMLDGPNVSVYVLRRGNKVLATALLADEGGFNQQDAASIFVGKRRFRGHLLAQSLSQHLGLEQAAGLRCRRVMRIAVHPALQRQGFGAKLLDAISQQAQTENIDYLGASFAADAPLLAFWRQRGYIAVRLGLSRDASSGAHSAAVLRPLSDAGGQLCAAASARFGQQFPHQLADGLRQLEPELGLALMRECTPLELPRFSELDRRDLITIAFAARVYEATPEPVWRLVSYALSDAKAKALLDRQSQTLLLCRVLQRRDWPESAKLSGLSGRKQAISLLRQALGELLEHYADEGMRAEIRRVRHLL